jgi:hypothetical protein
VEAPLVVDNRDEEIEINRIRARLASLEAERAELEASLAEIERRRPAAPTISRCPVQAANNPNVTTASPTADKVALFRRLFAGRSDVFPLRWENQKTGKSGYAPACANEWVRGVCGKPQVKCGECPSQAFVPVSDGTIDKHLRSGDGPRSAAAFVAGVYPMLPDETCWFLAADFDKESWAADAVAMIETCKAKGVPAALERSRSGNGAHVWIFFSEPVPARAARQLGAAIMTETMERRPEIGFTSYDRFFPSQDTMPVGGFGNLIALPLLILVHRRELLAQWVERLKTFLDIDPKHIGVIGGGRRKPTGVIDVALIQSLVRGGEVSDLVADHGHLVFDECHHLSAASFELVARRAKARYVLGLSATVARKDGHHPIIFMQCGPVRHRVDARTQAAERGVAHRAKHRATRFQLPPPLDASDRPAMPAVYAALARDEPRNELIFDDVLKALEA